MKKKYLFILFIAVALIQAAIPVSMMIEQEDTLATGTPFKFRTQPVDPNDPFRGKYIILNYEIDEYSNTRQSWERGEAIYVYLKNDASGYAQIETISKEKLPSRSDYVVGEVNWGRGQGMTIYFDFPFDRFYMNEAKAKPAENIVNLGGEFLETYALIHVKNGTGVIKDVYVNDIPIGDYVDQ